MTFSEELHGALRLAGHVILMSCHTGRMSLGYCLSTDVSQHDEEPQTGA